MGASGYRTKSYARAPIFVLKAVFKLKGECFHEQADCLNTYCARTLYNPNMCSIFGICQKRVETANSTESRSGIAAGQIRFRYPYPCPMASGPRDGPQPLQFDTAAPNRNARNISTSMPERLL